MTHYRRLAFASVLTLLLVAGCQSPESPFVGKWVGLDGRVEIEFFSDQTALIVEPNDPETIAGTWLVLEDGRVKLDFTQRGGAQIITGVLEEEQIVFTIGGNSIAFQRAGSAESSVKTASPEDPVSSAARLRASCANNLKQLGLGMKMFANESRGAKLPPLDARRGVLMMEASTFHPEYVPDTKVFVCPTQDPHDSHDTISHDSYWYLGYTLPDEETAMAFLKAYPTLDTAEARGQDIRLNESLSGGHEQIFVLREGIERFFITDINDPRQSSGLQSRIPIMVEKPENHGGDGGNVLYLDGHVEYLKYPGKYPMTKEFIEGLQRLEQSQH